MSTRVTRSSVLGKRGHQDDDPQKAGQQLHTPDTTPSPKRSKTAVQTVFDGEGNKENIPPFRIEALNGDASPTSARAARALRRTATEVVIPRPDRRRRASASSIATSAPSTPTKEEPAEVALDTPPPTPPTAPALPLPLHARVKASLRATCNSADATVAGRDDERAIILNFLLPFVSSDAMQAEGPSTLFISGSPGTGKTALVNAVNDTLAREHADLAVVFVNCMTVKTVDALWDRIIEQLRSIHGGPGRSKKEKGMAGVLDLLNARDKKLILVLDELDHIASNLTSLASLFSLAEKTTSSLRVIGIANTHTLTADTTCSNDDSNVKTLHFAPYTPTQLHAILRARLASIYEEAEASPSESNDIKKLLPNPSLVLLTKRIANLTGDVRSLFEVLRGAIDLAIAAKNKASPSDVLDNTVPSTSPQHILAALKAFAPANKSSAAASSAPAVSSNSEVVNKVRNLGFQARIVLLSLLLASKRIEAGLNITTSLLSSPTKKTAAASPVKRAGSASSAASGPSGAGLDTQQLYAFYSSVLQRSDLGAFSPVSRADFGDLLNVLEGVGLVQLSSSSPKGTPAKGSRAFGRSASFGAGLARNGAGTVGEAKLVEGVWAEEVLRGLGITAEGKGEDLVNEEMKGIWVAECAKIARDVKTLEAARREAAKVKTLGFEDASED